MDPVIASSGGFSDIGGVKFIPIGFTSALAASFLLAGPSANHRASYCEHVPFSGYTSDGTTLFIGTATADSIPGKWTDQVSYSPFDSAVHAIEGPPFGQVIRVDRLSTYAPPSLRKAIKTSNGRILVVPWESNCGTGKWRQSALAIRPGSHGFISVRLLPRKDWKGGLPTFYIGIAYDEDVPYPGLRYSSNHFLNAMELLSFLDSIPRENHGDMDVATRYMQQKNRHEAIVRWAARHPEQSGREPVSLWNHDIGDWAIRAAFDTITSPFAGSYRFVVRNPAGDSTVFYGRTAAHPSSVTWNEGFRAPERVASDPFGYYLLVGTATTTTGMPAGWPAIETDAFIVVSFHPVISTPDSTVWSAGVEHMPPSASAMGAGLKASLALQTVRYDLRARSGPIVSYAPGRMVRHRDGSLVIEMNLKAGDSTVATITGTRISKTTFHSPNN
jgi:hypothetical protein